MLDGAGDELVKLCAIKGFEEVVDCAAAKGVGRDMKSWIAVEHHDRDCGVVAADVVEEGEAVGAGHHDVDEDEVVVGVLLEAGDGCFGAVECGCGVTALF